MNIDSVLKELYLEKILVLEFPSSESREKFRQRLYKEKQAQDQILSDILDEDRQKLRFELIDSFIDEKTDAPARVERECCRAKMWLTPKTPVDYKIISIDETSNESSNPAVSGSVGETPEQPEEASKGSGSS